MLVRVIALISLLLGKAFADNSEVRESFKCVKHFTNFENRYLIPADTLLSIAIKESGRAHKPLKMKIPWPWTVNVQGSGYYFDSKAQAVDFVKKQIIKGVENIDVGCMQINLKHHAAAFNSLEDAFDPKINIAYAAKFLKSKYISLNSWHKAIAHYHSATFDLGYKYKEDVINIAKQLSVKKYLLSPYPLLSEQKEITKTTYRTPPPVKSLNLARLKSNLMVPVYPKKY